jgi:ubiquinone/menaquinone biosynthesis C-methylase UbiE
MSGAILESKGQDVRPAGAVADFNRLAPFYRWMEWFTFGPLLQKCRLAFLPEMRCRKSALILGDGDGRFTARLLEDNPQVQIDAVDASDAMLRQLMRRAGHSAVRVRTHWADARQLNFPAGSFDLIATHFFLDCLTTSEAASLALNLRGRMAPGGVWVISEFAIPDNPYGRLIAGPLVSALYLAFRLLTGLSIRRLPDHHESLREAGFMLSKQRMGLGGLLVSEMWLDDKVSAAPSGSDTAPP